MEVYLYSTLGCHLCEQAKTLLWPQLARYQCRLLEKDIADDDALIERYGTRIPVLVVSDLSDELGWPFSEVDVGNFLAKHSLANT